MGRIDETRPFLAVNIAVLTVSDTRTLETDTSGATLAERIIKSGHTVAVRATDNTGAVQTAVIAGPFPNGATGYHVVDIGITSG